MKSLVAYPIIGYGDPNGPPIAAALVVDTDRASFFKHEDEASIQVYLEHFAVRLDLETSINKLLHPPAKSSQEQANGKRTESTRNEGQADG